MHYSSEIIRRSSFDLLWSLDIGGSFVILSRVTSALVLLTRLQIRAALRRAWRRVRTPKGATFAVIGGLVFLLWLAPMLFTMRVVRKSDPDTVRLVAPVALLLLAAATLAGGGGKGADRAISFTPAEVNFLFPGPFTRRQLLMYKLARSAAGALLTGLIVSVVLLQHAQRWPAAFAAGTLAMLFVQLLTVAIILAAQTAGARAYSAGRRAALGVIACAVLAAIFPAARDLYERGTAGGGIIEAARVLNESPVSRVVLAPLVPFARLFTAASWGGLLTWGAVAAAIDAALLALILRLDADYREVAIAASERMMQRLERVRRGQVVQQSTGTGAPRRTRLPMFPWVGGAGPTAWRQLVTAFRTSRGVLFVLFVIACFALVPMFVSARSLTGPIVAAAAWGTIMLTAMLKFDFRAEVDQMAWLKALPLRPTATAAGQLAVPTLFITLLQLLLLGAAAWAAPSARERLFLLAALPFLLPVNLLIVGVENLLFLLFPSRPAGAAPGDISALGRQIVFVLLKMLMIATVAGVAAGAAAAAYAFTGPSVVPALAVGFVVLAAAAVAIVPLVGLAYARFDPSMDTPA